MVSIASLDLMEAAAAEPFAGAGCLDGRVAGDEFTLPGLLTRASFAVAEGHAGESALMLELPMSICVQSGAVRSTRFVLVELDPTDRDLGGHLQAAVGTLVKVRGGISARPAGRSRALLVMEVKALGE